MDAMVDATSSLLPDQLRDMIEANNQSFVVAMMVILVTFFILVVSLNSGRKGSTFLLVGPCNSGKTTLFYQLVNGCAPDCGTVASMQENIDQVALLNAAGAKTGTEVTCVDMPGHERLRHKLEHHLNDARAIVFVVDAADITPSKVEAAEELFQVLTNTSVYKRRLPILLACNKMDLETQAHSIDFVRRTIEKQLEAMKKTQSAISKEAAAKVALLGTEGKPFSLAAARNHVSVAAISALRGDIADVHTFLRSMS